MSLYVRRDDHCCSLALIGGFGGTTSNGYSKRDGYYKKALAFTTLDEFLTLVHAKIAYYDDSQTYPVNRFRQLGLVGCTAISLQDHAIKVLREFGGWTETVSGKMGKFDHELHSFFMPIPEFIRRYNELAAIKGTKLKLKKPEYTKDLGVSMFALDDD